MELSVTFVSPGFNRAVGESVSAFGGCTHGSSLTISLRVHIRRAYTHSMTEEQPYTLVHEYDGFELRHYPDYVLVQVEVEGDFMRAGNVAFGPLVSYISGNNSASQKIAMTAPVLQETREDHSHIVSFVLPEGMDISQVPVPRNARVTTKHVPAHYAAAKKFGGGWNAERFQFSGENLVHQVHQAGLVTEGNVYYARFDPPWKPWFLKRNEVLIAVHAPGV